MLEAIERAMAASCGGGRETWLMTCVLRRVGMCEEIFYVCFRSGVVGDEVPIKCPDAK